MPEVVEESRQADALTYASDNVRHLARMEIPGGGQIVIKGQLAFVGHQHGPEGPRSSILRTRGGPES